ncbi:hypothetical protein SISNIDRAFT_454224 [Sistotremastrum niveocremeum HHB9708]|uniref:F-box domain-containing protein n=1 Tax=Sistotremastrum niveocremeum HHB9708 TaxID=1314777 RepID=A0A164V3U7_9AGAM|nr:hypothetical protein SISNIDRAFT_454224 [Sistotremastrum niveocremeum HHB9708]
MLHVGRRSSQLEVLDFHLPSQWDFLELSPTYVGSPNFLEELPSLREIHLPMRHIPPEMIRTLSQMKNLHLLNTCPAGLERDSSMCCKPETDIYPDEVEFPSLSSLFLHMPFAPLQKCATSLLFAPQLSSLYIEIPDSVNPASKQFQLILKLVSEACMNLISLILRKSQPETPLLYPRERILFEAIRPALYLEHLRVFELYDSSPLCISDDEMAELASQWPEIEILRLCPEALQDSTVDLPALPSLASLFPLARHCPKLRHLGLQVDATVRVSRLEGDLSTGIMFSEELKELDLTWSKINSPAEVAAFLLEIIPSHVVFSYRPGIRSLQSHTHWMDRPRNDPANKEHLRMWTEAENILNALRPHRVMVDRMKRELIKLNEQLKWLEGI